MSGCLKVFWKGECVGAFSAEEIVKAVNMGSIGLYHTVERAGGRPVTVKVFLEGLSTQSHQGAADSEEKSPVLNGLQRTPENFMIYGICGLCFIFPPLYAALLAIVYYLMKSGAKPLAARVALTGLATSALGTLFWMLLMAVF